MTTTDTKHRPSVRDIAEFLLACLLLWGVLLAALYFVGGGRATLTSFFAWPNGSAWSNLLASAILAVSFVRSHVRIRARQHAELLAQQERHHAERMATANATHALVTALHEKHVGPVPDHYQRGDSHGGMQQT